MITEKELLEGIAECQGQRNPNANTCVKLASFYTILDHISENEKNEKQVQFSAPVYSYSAGSERYESDTEFGYIIRDMDEYEVMEIMDELMSTLSVVEPRLYASVIRKLKGQ